MTIGEETHIREWEWKVDPRVEASPQDLQEQFDFLMKIRDTLSRVNRAINSLRSVRSKIEAINKELKDRPESAAIIEAGEAVRQKLTAIEDVLIQAKSKSGQDPLNYPIKLDNRIAALASVVASADARPTDQSRELFNELAEKADVEIARLQVILETDIPGLNELFRDSRIPHIIMEKSGPD
jgi:phage-related tail protein